MTHSDQPPIVPHRFSGLAVCRRRGRFATVARRYVAAPTQPSAADRQIVGRLDADGEQASLGPSRWTTRSRSARMAAVHQGARSAQAVLLSERRRRIHAATATSWTIMFKRGDIRFAYDVFARFLARVDERVTMAPGRAGQAARLRGRRGNDPRPGCGDVRQDARRSRRALAAAREVRPAQGNRRRRRRWTRPSRSSASATTASARAGSKPTTTSCWSVT